MPRTSCDNPTYPLGQISPESSKTSLLAAGGDRSWPPGPYREIHLSSEDFILILKSVSLLDPFVASK